MAATMEAGLITKNVDEAITAFMDGARYVLYVGDCADLLSNLPDNTVDLTVTSPPYFMGKDYDRSYSIDDFKIDHSVIVPEVIRIGRPDRSICWQVGHHVQRGRVEPLDFFVHSEFSKSADMVLRNRIIWQFGHGVHCARRFSGRYETVLWYTKGGDYYFDLDSVRVQKKYPGKRHYKGPKKGEFSGNPLGKNPGDIWDIPNVKANHVEKTEHPCQFPVALVDRLISSLTLPGESVLDPFSGAGTTGVSALLRGRRFIGSELREDYAEIAAERMKSAISGSAKTRRDIPVWVPREGDAVAKRPDHFRKPTMES